MVNHTENMYPVLPLDPALKDVQEFRLKKICEIQKFLEDETEKYGRCRRKIKKLTNALTILNTLSQATSVVVATTTLGMAVTNVNLPFTIPLAVVAVTTGALSAGLNMVQRKILTKIMRYNQIETMASTKLGLINELVSRTLNDHRVDENEFRVIEKERVNYVTEKNNIKKKYRMAVKQSNEEMMESFKKMLEANK